MPSLARVHAYAHGELWLHAPAVVIPALSRDPPFSKLPGLAPTRRALP